MQIAVMLPYLADSQATEDTSVSTRFWNRADRESFFKAVERLGFIPDPHLKAKYLDRRGRPDPADASDSHKEKADNPVPD